MLRRALFLFCFSVVSALRGQSPGTAAIRGQALDQSGAAMPDVEVRIFNPLTGFSRTAMTDGQGFYLISEIPLTGEYSLTAKTTSFAAATVEGLRLRAAEAVTVNLVLKPAPEHSEVTVYGAADGVRSDSPELGVHLDSTTIQNTAVLGRKLTSLALLDSAVRPARGVGDLFLNSTLFVINGGGRRQTSFVVDGGAGDDAWGRQTIFTNIPLLAMQEVTVLTNAFSAEFGRTSGGVINVNTRSGTNQYHGEALGLWRPAGIQARNPLAERRTADRLGQWSGALSGPLRQNQTHFLLAVEHSSQDRDSTVTSPLAPQNYLGKFRQTLFLARLDEQIDNRNSLAVRLNFDRLHDTNPSDAVGGLTLPSAARTFGRRAYSAQLSETATIRPALVNVARVTYQIGSPITQFEPVNPSTQFVMPGAAVSGESRSASLINHQWQLADTLSSIHGRHHLKMGGDLLRASSGGTGQEFGAGFVLGQFTLRPNLLKPLESVTLADVQRFAQSFGNTSYHLVDWIASAFLQDSLKLKPALTLDLGLRYDRQAFTDDTHQIAPRAGFAWNPLGDAKTVVRGGYGLFYSQIRDNLAATFGINGPEGIFSFSAAPGQFGFPSALQALTMFPQGAILPPRDIFVRPGQAEYLGRFFEVARLVRYPRALLNPRTQQTTLGAERQIARGWIASVDVIHQRTARIERPLDLNAPAPFPRTAPGQIRPASEADATRPIRPAPNGYRRIVAILNEGMAAYNALQVNVRRRFSRRFSALASYTYSHAINTVEPDVPGQDPNDANQLGKLERATSLLDQRHRAVLSGWCQLPRHWVIGGISSLASGRPFNVTTGVDNNGDGVTSDRPIFAGHLVGRNAGRGTPVYDVQAFFGREFPLAGDRVRLTLRGEVFNLLNHGNIVGRNGVYGNDPAGLPAASFGQALGGINNVDPGREFQFQLRLSF